MSASRCVNLETDRQLAASLAHSGSADGTRAKSGVDGLAAVRGAAAERQLCPRPCHSRQPGRHFGRSRPDPVIQRISRERPLLWKAAVRGASTAFGRSAPSRSFKAWLKLPRSRHSVVSQFEIPVPMCSKHQSLEPVGRDASAASRYRADSTRRSGIRRWPPQTPLPPELRSLSRCGGR